MKRIDLAEPFEKVAAALSSLPLTNSRVLTRTEEAFKQLKVKQLLREIYEAANGRHVATNIGIVSIAPAIAPGLKEKPFYVATQAEFLWQAVARVAEHLSDKRAAYSSRSRVNRRTSTLTSTASRQAQEKRSRDKQPCLTCDPCHDA
jgi:hypothetical protein